MQELSFCGENRHADLERLKSAYDDVAEAASQLKPGKPVEKPINRVVMIHAERGLGKTRLAMELYRHLTTACDPEHYWPDDYARLAERVAVMPEAENNQFNYNATSDFVWWGLAVADGPNPGNTVFNSLEDLLPHLTAAQLWARRKSSKRALVAEALDLASEVGIEIADASIEVAGDAIGIGMIKRIGESVLNIGSIVKKHINDGDAPLDAAGKRIDSVVDGVMADLSRLFSPASKQFVGIPLVVLIDDAQFADRDQATAAFTEKLIAASSREGWPLLLVFTHWSRQLRKWRDGQNVEQPRSKIAEVLHHASSRRSSDPGPFTGVGGDTLSEERYVQIDLGEPVGDLTPALKNQFPGLSEQIVAQIIEKSGGNPRKLEQIAARMKSRPIWFQDMDQKADLTEDGCEKVLELSELPIDEIVLERLHDTAPDARRALLLASVLGSRFVVSLVDRLSEARFETAARDGLKDGEVRYRFVRDVVDQSRNDIARFTERLFAEAAETYRHSGMASVSLENWPKEDELYQILDELLDALVEEPESFDGLSLDDFAHAFDIASDRMLLAGSPNASLALARLVHIQNEIGNYEGAYVAAERFDEKHGSGSDSFEVMGDTSIYLLGNVADTLARKGERGAATRIFAELLSSLKTLAARDPDNLQWQRDLSVSHDKVGDMLAATGDRPGALAEYSNSLEIAATLTVRDPDNADWKRDLSISHDNVGDMLAETGDRSGALAEYSKAMKIRAKLAARDPDNAVWQSDLSISYNKAGNILAATGDRSGALAEYRKAMKIVARLAADNPDNAEWKRNLSIGHNKVGGMLAASGDRLGALSEYRKAMQICAKLAERDPDNVVWQSDLSICHDKIGDMLAATGDFQGALLEYHKGMNVAATLAASDPNNAVWQRDLIVRNVKLAEVGTDAAKEYKAALNIAQTLHQEGRLLPSDHWMLKELEQRLKQAGG